jgi:hypothetical protein
MALYLKEHLTFDRAEMMVESVKEGDSELKTLYMKGIFIQGGVKNANERVYPVSEIGNAVDTLNTQIQEGNSVLGEVDHPDDLKINLDRVSHMIVSLREDGNNWIGKAKVMDTPMGRIVKELISEGAQLGVSSRGLGSLKERNGINEVQNDFMLATAADIVADPSAPDAFVSGIMEGREWIFINNKWTEQDIEESKGLIQRTSSANLEEAKLQVFSNFLDKLSKF